jgi:hypothetical protein
VLNIRLTEPVVVVRFVQLAEQDVEFVEDQEISTVSPKLISYKFELIEIEGSGIIGAAVPPPPPPPQEDKKIAIAPKDIYLFFML